MNKEMVDVPPTDNITRHINTQQKREEIPPSPTRSGPPEGVLIELPAVYSVPPSPGRMIPPSPSRITVPPSPGRMIPPSPTPTVPSPSSHSLSAMKPVGLTLKMPNIANPRPSTSPINIYRTASETPASITIPSNLRGASTTSPVNIPKNSPPKPEKPKPPVLQIGTSNIENVTSAVRSEIAISANLPVMPVEPLIKREDMVSPINRPMSPRDGTEITIHGVPIDRTSIIPILSLGTSSDDEDDEILVDISDRAGPQAPTTIITMSDISTEDTTDGSALRHSESVAPTNIPLVHESQMRIRGHLARDNETYIQPAAPTAQVQIPQPVVVSSPTPLSSSNLTSDSIINPAPPVTSVTSVHQQRFPTSRGRQSIPSMHQPLPVSTPGVRQPTSVHASSIQPNVRQPMPVQSMPVTPIQTPIQSSTSIQSNARQPTPIQSNARQPTPIQSNVRQPMPVQPNVRQPTPVSAQSGVRQPTPVSAQSGVRQPISVQSTPVSTQPNLRQPIPVQSTPVSAQPNLRQPTPVQSTPTPGVRQPTPISTQSGVRQPTPISTQPGVRQPMPVQPLPVQPLPVQSTPVQPTPVQPVPVQSLPVPQPTPIQQSVPDSNIWDTTPIDNETVEAAPAPTITGATPALTTLPPPNVPDYASMSTKEQAQHRANFRTRFGLLREAWPTYHIPDYGEDMPLEQIHAQYDIYVRHIHISNDVDQYKVYLVIMWLLIELFCIKIGLNIGGYTVAQMRSMNKYERLLIELGETSYKTSAAANGGVAPQSSWPVEVRIFFMALVNAVTFIIIKMLADYIGEGLATTIVDALSSFLSGSPPQPGQVLFGGSGQASGSAPMGSSNGAQALPQMGGPFGGIDIASLIGTLGSTFLRGQTPTAPAPQATASQAVTAQPTTPRRFLPAYSE